jgi:hypothetical protein
MDGTPANLQHHESQEEGRAGSAPMLSICAATTSRQYRRSRFAWLGWWQKIVRKQKASPIPILLRLRARLAYRARHGLAPPGRCSYIERIEFSAERLVNAATNSAPD